MKNIITSAVVALVVALLVVGLVGGKSAAPTKSFTAGGVTNFDNLTLTTSNTATSTLAAGCYQTTATSTASPIVLVFGSTLTSTSTFPSGLTTANGGVVSWRFGSCPL